MRTAKVIKIMALVQEKLESDPQWDSADEWTVQDFMQLLVTKPDNFCPADRIEEYANHLVEILIGEDAESSMKNYAKGCSTPLDAKSETMLNDNKWRREHWRRMQVSAKEGMTKIKKFYAEREKLKFVH